MSETWMEALRRDHEVTERVFDAGERLLNGTDEPDRALVGKLMTYLKGYVEGCHNRKEEEHLFPLLVARGFPREAGPLAMMLYEHEQSRELLAQVVRLGQAYKAGAAQALAELREAYRAYIELLKSHFWKENDILYPSGAQLMSEADAATVLGGIVAVEASLGPDTRQRYYTMADELVGAAQLEDLAHALDLDTLAAILNTLPIELSFIDANDTVRYFSHEHQPKIFPRTRGSIGVQVQNCHPQKSLHLVQRVIAELKSGRRQVAEFWIDHEGRKVHIRYWAVRNAAGEYLGCLETVQDVTAIQRLEGQRRLLDDSRS